MKNLIKVAAVMGLLGMSVGANASTINVGGVNWDPDYIDASDIDWLGKQDFTQWYTASNSTPSAISNYGAAVNILPVLASLDPNSSASTGYFLQGVGEFNHVNEGSSDGNPFFFMDANKEMTWAFGGIGLNKDSSFDLSNAWARFYVNSTSPDNFSNPASNQTEVTAAQTGLLWLDMDITSLAFSNGTVGNGSVSATLQAIGGAALGHFQPNLLTYSADARFFNGSTPLNYSAGGNGSFQGNTIPEPTSLALLGIGLLGFGASRVRKQA